MTLSFANYHAHVEQILQAALAAADPVTAVRRHLERRGKRVVAGSYRYRLGQGRIFVIAAGKAHDAPCFEPRVGPGDPVSGYRRPKRTRTRARRSKTSPSARNGS